MDTTASFVTLPPTPETYQRVGGTHLIDYITTSYDNLVNIFGPPQTGDEHKTDAEWIIEFNDGTIATIYNYKNGQNYLGTDGMPVAEITNWHIGGRSDLAAERVRAAIDG